MSLPESQSRYQVRFAFGIESGSAIAEGAHVVVWVDALPEGATPGIGALGGTAAIVSGSIGSRAAVAQWILDRQASLGDRAFVAVVAAGGRGGAFAVEDLVAAGAVIDALGELGIDYTSPEAAAAAGAFLALKNAGSHVLSASVAGQLLLATEGPEALDAARAASAAPEFEVLREG
ncbi:2-phosphosulfolactate phosphatase [Microbacteriaceae bacterium SG_E_30_P1]|uniref:Probable 2-phosphosulfolactate phosphatase n=1 Tax=Antiquaquibacter oligotrophicus TaxID=2880260 RepID=A0ABT6KIU1_9MICO|nr:2-phosphosulfolactate phosphatase [Antiquaquibacter oligotrophicus]MDH6179868.1 2-phosphosulfolactate phosphatase [Antiquaquibacter oligotrophicus]UDF14371.1 2-phosphosulfolactate phosphatase [Antiquaquibacter oligotrophicus]